MNNMYDSSKYPEFAKKNSGTGTVKVQVFIANQAYPLKDIDIKITKEIDGNEVIFFTGKTNSSGIIDDIKLPAEPAKEDIESAKDITYTTYNITVTNPKSNTTKKYDIAVFDGMKIIQPINLPVLESDGSL